MSPLPLGQALPALARCAVTTARLMARRQLHQPTQYLGRRVRFADGTTGVVYRETVIDHGIVSEPAVLLVEFRLRGVHGRGHAVFRAESLLNTPLFAGFPGFVSKLWMAADERGRYRGLYQWDGAHSADQYVRALWWVLALVSNLPSIRYHVVPGAWRDDALTSPRAAVGGAWATGEDWCRPVAALPAAR
jgi:hypothetical protein